MRNVVRLDGTECIKETDRALLVVVEDGTREVWIPKSVVDDDSEVFKEGDEGTLVVHEWFAQKEDLE